jgi:hypothetical protein
MFITAVACNPILYLVGWNLTYYTLLIICSMFYHCYGLQPYLVRSRVKFDLLHSSDYMLNVYLSNPILYRYLAGWKLTHYNLLLLIICSMFVTSMASNRSLYLVEVKSDILYSSTCILNVYYSYGLQPYPLLGRGLIWPPTHFWLYAQFLS